MLIHPVERTDLMSSGRIGASEALRDDAPVLPREENHHLYNRYKALADAEPNTLFVGRLATYRYYNMDQVVEQALAARRKSVGPVLSSRVLAG